MSETRRLSESAMVRVSSDELLVIREKAAHAEIERALRAVYAVLKKRDRELGPRTEISNFDFRAAVASDYRFCPNPRCASC